MLDGVDIHHGQKLCKVYIQDVKNSDGTQEKRALIADSETGRAFLGSPLSKPEYSNLKKTGELDLFDIRRDPQTLAMNQKGIREAEILSRAQDQNCLIEISNIRRPYNETEATTDFVGTDPTGSKVFIDAKGIKTKLEGDRKPRPLNQQTEDIHNNILELFDNVDDPTKLRIVCDLSEAPTFLHRNLIEKITYKFDSDILNRIVFTY